MGLCQVCRTGGRNALKMSSPENQPSLKQTTMPCAGLPAQGALPADQIMKVLFIGNSQMGVYDLPGMMEAMALSAPADHPRIEIGRGLIGGKGLAGFWEAGEGQGAPRAMIAAEKWDCVVIQEIYCANEVEVEKYAAMFDELIRKSGSQTILFATANVTQFYSAAFNYPASFKKLNDMQIAFGKKRGIPVAAAGYAWMKYLGPHPAEEQILDLYHKDKGHPGQKGTYIYACLLYACITGLNPAGLTSEFKDIQGGIFIAQDEAAKMQQAAWEQYLESRNK